MDRETRRANLRKLQLPNTSENKQPKRKTCPSAKCTAPANTAITNYFITPESHNNNTEEISNVANKITSINSERNHDEDIQKLDDIYLKTSPRKRSKRTKLDAFIFKDPQSIPDNITSIRKSVYDDDFVAPEKKIKKAPKLKRSVNRTKNLKSSKAKKQSTIKSAFLRNEQLFAEIAAQHCAADQFDGEEIQLALAISKSEAENKGIGEVNRDANAANVNLEDGDRAESIREKLKIYGFRTAEKKDYNAFAAAFLPKNSSRRPKSKWANKFTALTLRSSEKQQQKLQDSIEKLLNSQFKTKSLKDHENVVPVYKFQSSLLKKAIVHEGKRVLNTAQNANESNERYFVTDLFEISQLPADHLLKDWTTIQGRDTTPNPKNKQSARSLKKLEQIYKDLEEYFSSRKRLDWTVNSDKNEEATVLPATKKERKECVPSEVKNIVGTTENIEQSKIIDVDENSKVIKEDLAEKTDGSGSGSVCDSRIAQLLPTLKSSDAMQVSSCGTGISTQATICTTQKNRTNSPDLFADSDAEMEEAEKNNCCGGSEHKLELEERQGDITSYELFSSDEVKNTFISKRKKSAVKENKGRKMSAHDCTEKIIDLTQDECQSFTDSTTHEISNKIKSISEIDIFADSPPQIETEKDYETVAINCNLQASTENSFKEKYNGACVEVKKIAESAQLSTSLKIQENSKEFTMYKFDDSETVLRELELDQSKITVVTDDKSDERFQKLCKKYLHNELGIEPLASDKKVTGVRKSFSQILPTIQRPHQCDLVSYSKFDLDMTVNGTDIFKRKSRSFAAKDPFKTEFNDAAETFPLSPSRKLPENSKEFTMYNFDGSDTVLRELELDQSKKLFSNFRDSREAQNYVYKISATAGENVTDDKSDERFQKLCKKYLNNESGVEPLTSDKKITGLRKSFSQILPTIQRPHQCDKLSDSKFDLDMTANRTDIFKRKSRSYSAKDPFKTEFNNTAQMLSKSQSFTNNISSDSTDLTQQGTNKSDGDIANAQEEDYIVLSDDEINYSIFQADKAKKYQISEQSFCDYDDAASVLDPKSSTDDESIVFCGDQIANFSSPHTNHKVNYSYLEFEDTEKPLIKAYLSEAEGYISDSEIITTKYATAKSTIKEQLKFNGNEFGILDEHSEPIDDAFNSCTPTKVLTEASFMSSPSESTEPIKLYNNCHRSSHKFQDLIHSIESNSPPGAVHDRLADNSSLKFPTAIKIPEGFDQLLTAEISYKESENSPQTTNNIPSTSLTSSAQQIKHNGKIYTVRHTVSPKPDYTKYSEAELFKELYNFGIKPLKRKQAVKMLEYIYNQTHPILTEEEENQPDQVVMLDNLELPCTSTPAPEGDTLMSKPSKNVTRVLSQSNGARNKLHLQDSCGLRMLRYSNDLKAELSDETYIFQTNVTKKTPQPLVPLHIAWYNLVCSNPQLHESILMYEPVDLQEIYLFLKTLGYRYDPKDLKIFFDRRCIIFRYDLANGVNGSSKTKDKNRHVRKQGKS